jgi:two-component system sensor histidine kinase/response regulator
VPESGVHELFSVLLIDDQPMVAEAVRRLIGPETQFRSCSQPAEAIQCALEIGPTVILLDLVMPVKDGLVLLSEIRAHPQLQKIPVIMLSTREDPEKKAMAFERGANDYLIKLPHRVELLARLRYHSLAYIRMLQRDHALQALHESQKLLEENNRELQRVNQQLSEANRARGQFLARMSHEIRTPINGILGVTQLLKRTPLHPRQAEYAGIISTSGELLLSLIEDILDFSKMEADKLVLEEVDFELAPMVEQVMQLVAVPAHKKGLEFVSWIHPEVPEFVRGDPTRIRQILLNLIGNAVKFTAQGQVRVELEVAEQSSERLRLKLSVHDTGIGISAEQQSRLFQAFAQADSSTTRRFGGTGLGLAIARHLCEQMGGWLDLESETGRGSVFRAEIWLGRSLQSPSRTVTVAERVLVVDDSPWWRRSLRSLMSEVNQLHCVTVAEAYQLEESNWSTVLIDSKAWDDHDWAALFPEARLVRLQPLGEDGTPDGFILTKPVRRAELIQYLEPAEAPAATVVLETTPSQQAHLLLVEDNLINQTIALEMLQELGYQVDLAENGLEAVELSAGHEYAVIIMDCEMPEMDGYQATRAIRARESGQRRTPIVAMTAYAMQGDRERCLEAGMDDYVTKPFDMDRVAEVIRRWLAPISADPSGALPR